MRKNIIFLMADQLGASFLGCYGSGVNSTPNLDRLADEGSMFTRCYASSPLCAPNRATFLTGRSAEVHGIVTNNFALTSDTPTYAHVLRKNGYKTGGFGKFHQTPMLWPVPVSLDFLGFDKAIVSEDPKWGPWLDWVKENYPDHLDAALAVVNGHGGTIGPDEIIEKKQGASEEEIIRRREAFEKHLKPRINESEWPRMYTSPLPAEVHDTSFITEKGLEFIDECSKGAAPFFCHISYVDPHDPYDPPAPYDKMFNPDEMPEPLPAEWEEEGSELLESVRDNYLQFQKICGNQNAVKTLRALYHGSLKFMDDQIGRIVEKVKSSGLWEDTIIIFTTDHGEMMGDHGLIGKGIPQYDKGIRCPLIVAGGAIKNQVTDRLTCSLDFFAAFCEWAGTIQMDIPPVEGKSFAGICQGLAETDPWEEILVGLHDHDTVITNDGFRLTRYEKEGQMFDLIHDPGEQKNLYNIPEYTEKKVELLERLMKARARERTIVQYRNMPVKDGLKYHPNIFSEKYTFYDEKPSPWLTNCEKPQWRQK